MLDTQHGKSPLKVIVVLVLLLVGNSSGSTVAASQPRSSNAAPAKLSQAQPLCFAQNGLCIQGEFRSFWEQNGGTEVFGLPISAEYSAPVVSTSTTSTTKTTQTSPDSAITTTTITTTSTTKYFTTQWFERASFEFHPENKEPYRVLLGRVGDMALRNTDRTPAGFPRAAPGMPNYFPETGQSIAPQFWDYWRQHGLNMGQEGVSLQESLALFGYPISPAIMERLSDGKEHIVQYFERARFEHHVENADLRYQVLLGLLGPLVMPAGAPTAGSSNNQPANTGSAQSPTIVAQPVPAQPPAPPPPPTVAQPQSPAVSVPPRSAASSGLDRLNWYRGITGLGQFGYDGALASAAAAHANYLVQNPSGDLHNETAGRAGFTGVTAIDRARAAGYYYPSAFFVTDLVIDSRDPVASIDQLIDLPMHRVLMLNPQYTQMGIGSAVFAGRAYTVVVLATVPAAASTKGEPKVVAYPVNGQSGVPVSWDYSEWPSPLPAGSPRPAGYPLTLTGAYGTMRVEAAWLKDAQGATVSVHPNPAVCLSNAAYNCYQIMPVRPLSPNTTYTAYGKGLIGGRPFEYTWSFKTGTASAP